MTSLSLHPDKPSIWTSHSLIAVHLLPFPVYSKALVAMVENEGLEIVPFQPIPIPLELVSRFFVTDPGRLIHDMLAWLIALLPALLGYQFIAETSKYE